MMQQPELGKKISELRLDKGLTQEELAQRCNINVRTLQRIEANEVNPRMYTIRILFTELGADAFHSEYRRDGKQVNLSGKLKVYIAELFNLKTNTMKKISIIGSPLILAFIILFFTSFSTAAQQRKNVKMMIENQNKNFMNYFNSGQIDSLAMMYHVHASLMPTGSPEMKGRDAIAGYYYFLYNLGFRFTENKTDKLTIKGSVLIDKGTWRLSKGNEEVMFGHYLTNWRKYNNGWFIETEMSTVASN